MDLKRLNTLYNQAVKFSGFDTARVLVACTMLICEKLDGGEKEEKMKAVVDAAQQLRRSGYDGPFMGEAVEPLFKALAAYEP